jgi:uncharacterized protein (TIGR00255 family)
MLMRNQLMTGLVRGKIDFTIQVEYTGKEQPTHINRGVMESYYLQIKELAEQFKIAEPVDWFSILLRLPEVVQNEATEVDDRDWEAIREAISQAIGQVKDFRLQEGESLCTFLVQKIDAIRAFLVEIEKYEGERIEKIRMRILDGLEKTLAIDYDKNRFEQEMIYYIEKLDVNEEKNRLINHLNYFLDTLENGSAQGKMLGFIAQEIGREINTLGSKSNHAEMQKVVVKMKDELEQIKEQTLNIL